MALACGSGLLVGCGLGGLGFQQYTKRQVTDVKSTSSSKDAATFKKSQPPNDLAQLRIDSVSGDAGQAEWLNRILLKLWPRIDCFVKNLVKESIEPSIQAKLPGMMRFEFTTVTLGEAVPRFGPLHVEKEVRGNEDIEIHLGLDLDTTLDLQLTIAGASLGLKQLVFRGLLTVVLMGKQDKPPFFQAVQVFFANPPQVDIDFSGVANVADVPGLKGIIRSAISGAVNSKLVLPARIAVDMNEEDDLDAGRIKLPEPDGIVRMTLVSGKGLKAMDTGLLGGKSSDPYVIIEAGQVPWTSPVVKANLNPEWTKDNVKDILVYDKAQQVSFQIWDADFMQPDDDMGTISGIPLVEFMKPTLKPVPRTLSVSDEGGTLTVKTEYLKLSTKGPSKTLTGAKLYFCVDVRDATGFPDSAVPPYTVSVTVGAETALSNGSAALGYKGGAIPKEHQAIAKKLDALKKCKLSAKEIGDILELTEEQASRLIMSDTVAAEAAKDRAKQKPSWEQVLPMLLPYDKESDGLPVTLELKDSKNKSFGKATPCKLADIINGKKVGETFDLFVGAGPSANSTVKLRANFHAKWLENAAV